MSSTSSDRQPASPRRPPEPPDVVAGLVNDGTAYAVARAAARHAAHRGSRVKFVQVAAPGLSRAERDDLDRATFRSALRALKGLQRVPCAFEVVDGDAGPALVEHSVGASLLVVGRDAAEDGRDVARHCQEHAHCDVLTVATDAPASTGPLSPRTTGGTFGPGPGSAPPGR